ncbi:MAG: RNA polymerase sporulation sigma factor SigK [Clostridia bacterium]|nr:RNA polymerase sporulation sigma factor SigK [Clostridia bacterium]
MFAFFSWLLTFLGSGFFAVSYVTSSTSFLQPLTPQEEADYIEKFKNGDTDAKNKLIEHNLRLVAHIAKKYTLKGFDSDDVISIGTIGLIKAIGSFKSGKGANLATYAARCIENEILMTIRSGKKSAGEVLLQDPVGKDKDGKEITLMDKLTAEGEESVFEEVSLKLRIKELYEKMREALCDREREILEMRYGLAGCDALTQMEISEMMGISRSYVSRIEKKAIGKLCKKMSKEIE